MPPPPRRARAARSRTRRWRPARRSRRRVCSRISLISSGVRPLRSAARTCIASSPSRPSATSAVSVIALRMRAVEPRARPDAAPGVARDQSWKSAVKSSCAAIARVDVRVAEHLAPDLHAALVGRRLLDSCRLHCGSRRQMIEQEPVERLRLLEVGEVRRRRRARAAERPGCAARSPRPARAGWRGPRCPASTSVGARIAAELVAGSQSASASQQPA